LINEETFEITDVVDWSLAEVQPFGMELDSLLLVTGYMDLNGWHNYTCRLQMLNAFWDEFWIRCQIHDDIRQREIRASAMQVAKIGAVLHYAFQRNANGSQISKEKYLQRTKLLYHRCTYIITQLELPLSSPRTGVSESTGPYLLSAKFCSLMVFTNFDRVRRIG
jgi:hypothetical protein